jgi:hypothetical protein
VPRRVASIDPQDFPCLPRRSPPAPPVPPVSCVRPPVAACPHHAVAFFPHQLPRPAPPTPVSSVARVAASPPVVPLRRPDYPSWFTSLSAISLALSRVSRNRAPTSPPILFRRCGPHHRRSTTHHHPAAAARWLLRRSIEADALSPNHAESDGSEELLRVRGWIPRQSFEWRSKPARWKRGRSRARIRGFPGFFGFFGSRRDDRAEFLRRPDFISVSSNQAYQKWKIIMSGMRV